MFLSVTQSRTSNIGGLSSGKPTVLLRRDSLAPRVHWTRLHALQSHHSVAARRIPAN